MSSSSKSMAHREPTSTQPSKVSCQEFAERFNNSLIWNSFPDGFRKTASQPPSQPHQVQASTSQQPTTVRFLHWFNGLNCVVLLTTIGFTKELAMPHHRNLSNQCAAQWTLFCFVSAVWPCKFLGKTSHSCLTDSLWNTAIQQKQSWQVFRQRSARRLVGIVFCLICVF